MQVITNRGHVSNPLVLVCRKDKDFSILNTYEESNSLSVDY